MHAGLPVPVEHSEHFEHAKRLERAERPWHPSKSNFDAAVNEEEDLAPKPVNDTAEQLWRICPSVSDLREGGIRL